VFGSITETDAQTLISWIVNWGKYESHAVFTGFFEDNKINGSYMLNRKGSNKWEKESVISGINYFQKKEAKEEKKS
jgi:hypothetical protein